MHQDGANHLYINSSSLCFAAIDIMTMNFCKAMGTTDHGKFCGNWKSEIELWDHKEFNSFSIQYWLSKNESTGSKTSNTQSHCYFRSHMKSHVKLYDITFTLYQATYI